jgi:hypothetical protein
MEIYRLEKLQIKMTRWENIKNMNLIIGFYGLSLLAKLKSKLIRHQHVTNIKSRSHQNRRNHFVLTSLMDANKHHFGSQSH